MTPDRWEDLVSRLTDAGKVESRVTEEIETHPGYVERVVVASPLGRICLSWTSEPKKLGEKALYSKRGGSTAAIQAKYDESDIIHVFSVERLDTSTGDWVHINPSDFQL